jgi:broad specificity phosphatase PhoE
MKLVLTRHGETVENTKKILQGHRPGRLSALGKNQAKKLAIRLKDEKFSAIYSSDLKRAVDTAKEIAKYHKNIPVHFIDHLRERNLGSYQGRKSGEIDWDNIPSDVETLESMQTRARKFLKKVHQKHSDETVLFVGHGGLNRAMLSVILKKKIKKFFSIEKPKNTSVYIIEIDKNLKSKVIVENCIKHLD